MSDPQETPAQAIERLRREISQLRRLRGQMPMLILEPYVEEASKHITEVASRLTVKATVPAATAITGSRETAQAETKPPSPPSVPPTAPAPGTRVFSSMAEERAIALSVIPTGAAHSPEEYEVLILTESGRLLSVPPEDLIPEGAIAPTAPAAPKLSPGTRVKIKTTGKTGYISEVAETNAIVALDEGGFITVPLADLEPL